MYFYETSFEISMSIVVGVMYIWEYDISAQVEESESNTLTRRVHVALVYTFFGMLVLSYVGVIVLMSQKVATLKRI